MVLVGSLLLGTLVGAAAEFAAEGRVGSMAVLPLVYAALIVVLRRLYIRRVDTGAELVRCRVVHPYGVGGAGLRIRCPDGALLAVALSDDKGAAVSEGDDLWCHDPQEGRPLTGVRWNPVLGRGEAVMGIGRSRLVVPPGAVPAALARDLSPPAGPQDRLLGEVTGSPAARPPGAASPSAPPRPLAIKPLGPPPPPRPDGIDEQQARAALAARLPSRWPGRRALPATPDVPLEVVTVTSPPPSPYAPRRGQVTVRRATGDSFAWETTLQRWPTAGSTVWATPVAESQQVRLFVPTPAGDILVAEPHGPARPEAASERRSADGGRS